MQYNCTASNTLKKIGVYKVPFKHPVQGSTIFLGVREWGGGIYQSLSGFGEGNLRNFSKGKN